MRLVLSHFFIAVLLAVSVIGAFAQTPDDEVIRISADTVFVPVSVLDRGGKYISTLKREDFKIFENGIEQEIETFETVDNSVTVLLLIERTGGIGTQLPRVVAAANAFVRNMRPEDSLIAMTFGSHTQTVIKKVKIKEKPSGIRVGRESNDRSGTQLFGSVDTALKTIEKIPGRKAVIVFSEGFQTDRFLPKTAKQMLDNAEEGEATVFTIRFGPVSKLPQNIQNSTFFKKMEGDAREFMTGLAVKTGGRPFEIDQIENLDDTFAEVAGELVKQYMLGYSPARAGSDGEKRKITVKVNIPNSVVRARKEVIYRKPK